MAQEQRDAGWALSYVDNPIEDGADTFEFGGLLARFAAMWIDRLIAAFISLPVVIALIVLFAVATGSTSSGAETSAAFLGFVIGYFGVSLAYDWIMTARGGGFGKRWLNLKVIRESDGRRPELGTAAVRVGVIWGLSWIPVIGSVLFVANCAWALGERRQAWHDLAAKTLVVKRYI